MTAHVTEIAYSEELSAVIGDKVRILNPHADQESLGVITKFTKNSYAKIKTKSQIIHRSVKNIVFRSE